jgi:hypothetical protein
VHEVALCVVLCRELAGAERTPYDGKPYYCEICGAGFYEFMTCERPDCRLERPERAEQRQLRQGRLGLS